MRWNWRHWWWKVKTEGPGMLLALLGLIALCLALYGFWLDYSECLQYHKSYECRAMLMSDKGGWLLLHNNQ